MGAPRHRDSRGSWRQLASALLWTALTASAVPLYSVDGPRPGTSTLCKPSNPPQTRKPLSDPPARRRRGAFCLRRPQHRQKKKAAVRDSSLLVRPGGFEPLAFGVGVQRSIQLSYDRTTCRRHSHQQQRVYHTLAQNANGIFRRWKKEDQPFWFRCQIRYRPSVTRFSR